jgi:hypothetical protein
MIISVFSEKVYTDVQIIPKGYNIFEIPIDAPRVNTWLELLELLKISDTTLIFILTDMQPIAKKQLETLGFSEYLIHQSPVISNPNYPSKPRRLTIYIYKGKGEVYEI